MTLIRSIKNRLRQLTETNACFRPIGKVLQFCLAQKLKFISLCQRLWILLRLVYIRIRSGNRLIVIYRDIGIGDLVSTFPLIYEIGRQYPDHDIVYVTTPQSRAFVARFSGADFAIGTSYRLYSQPLPRVPRWMATKSHFPVYIGEKEGEPVGDRRGYGLEMASSFGISLSRPRPTIQVDRESVASALHHFKMTESPRPFIGVHLGPTLPVREYPLKSWQELVTRLHDELGATVFRFGSKAHHSSETKQATHIVNVQFDFADRLDLIETTELLSTMNLFIGIDSGLLHIANATGVPSIGLFGPTDPAIVLSQTTGVGLFSRDLPCIFCQHRRLNLHWNTGCPRDIQCMKLISVDSILAQAKSMLETAGLLSSRAP